MGRSTLAAGIRQLRGKLAAQQRNEDSDEQLLHAFAACRDDSAFAVLVRRHGPMVLHVCRRVLGHHQDAEDAFQATFLVLARNAAALRKKSALAGFLHGTAYRTALKTKQSAARRRKHESQTPSRPPVDPADELSWREVRTLLDEEIARLPEIYRSVFILCYLENLSRAEAGQRLGLKECTVLSRLAEARKRLGRRLAKRGVELTVVLAAAALAVPPVSAVPAALAATTIEAAMGKGLSGVVSMSVAELVESATTAMMLSKAKMATLVLLTLSLLAGASMWAYQGLAANILMPSTQPAEPPAAKADDKPKAVPPKRETAKTVQIQGRVLDPDGKPKAGAKLLLLGADKKIVELGVTTADGRFSVLVPKKTRDYYVIAQAEGTGIDVLERGDMKSGESVELRLVKDQPIRGRVVNTEGKPVAGIRVTADALNIYPNHSLDMFLGHWKNQQVQEIPLGGWGIRDEAAGALFAATTDAEGRFVLRGIGAERFVSLGLRKAGLANVELRIATRPGFDPKPYNQAVLDNSPKRFVNEVGKEWQLHGPDVIVVAEPEKIIRGVVKEADTGKGRANVLVGLFGARSGRTSGANGRGGPLRDPRRAKDEVLLAQSAERSRDRLHGLPHPGRRHGRLSTHHRRHYGEERRDSHRQDDRPSDGPAR